MASRSLLDRSLLQKLSFVVWQPYRAGCYPQQGKISLNNLFYATKGKVQVVKNLVGILNELKIKITSMINENSL